MPGQTRFGAAFVSVLAATAVSLLPQIKHVAQAQPTARRSRVATAGVEKPEIPEKAPDKPPVIHIETGRRCAISARSVTLDETTCLVESVLFGPLRIPRAELRRIVFDVESDPLGGISTQDMLFCKNGDRVRGRVVTIEAGVVTAKALSADLKVPTKELEAISFARAKKTEPRAVKKERTVYALRFTNGDRIIADKLSLDPATCTFSREGLGTFALDAKLLRSVAPRRLMPPGKEAGLILLADYGGGRLITLDKGGEIVWEMGGFNEPRDARYLPNGNILVAEERGQRILEVSPDREIVWSCSPGKEFERVFRIPSGEIMALTRNWELAEVSPEGRLKTLRDRVHYVTMTLRENLLIANHAEDAFQELNERMVPIWRFRCDEPACIQSLPDGTFLVAHETPIRVARIDRDGKVLWEYRPAEKVRDAHRFQDGTTAILTEGGEIICVDADRRVLWSFTGAKEAKSLHGR